MNNLITAIYTLFSTTNDFNTNLGGRLYYGKTPQKCEYPYAVYFGVTSSPEDTFGEEIDEVSFQFNIYSDENSSVEVSNLLTDCRNLFDKKDLEVTGSKDVYLTREFSTPPWNNDEIWVSSIEFSTLIQEV